MTTEDLKIGSGIFQLFGELPLELRRLIWKHALPGPRLVEVGPLKGPVPPEGSTGEGSGGGEICESNWTYEFEDYEEYLYEFENVQEGGPPCNPTYITPCPVYPLLVTVN
jgi:hypothetical protein